MLMALIEKRTHLNPTAPSGTVKFQAWLSLLPVVRLSRSDTDLPFVTRLYDIIIDRALP